MTNCPYIQCPLINDKTIKEQNFLFFSPLEWEDNKETARHVRDLRREFLLLNGGNKRSLNLVTDHLIACPAMKHLENSISEACDSVRYLLTINADCDCFILESQREFLPALTWPLISVLSDRSWKLSYKLSSKVLSEGVTFSLDYIGWTVMPCKWYFHGLWSVIEFFTLL